MKEFGLISEPGVMQRHIKIGDQFAILATDGVSPVQSPFFWDSYFITRITSKRLSACSAAQVTAMETACTTPPELSQHFKRSKNLAILAYICKYPCCILWLAFMLAAWSQGLGGLKSNCSLFQGLH